MLALHLAKLVASHRFCPLAGGSGIEEDAGDRSGRGVVRPESEGNQKGDNDVSHVLRLPEVPRTIFQIVEVVAGGGIEPPTQGFSVFPYKAHSRRCKHWAKPTSALCFQCDSCFSRSDTCGLD